MVDGVKILFFKYLDSQLRYYSAFSSHNPVDSDTHFI